MRKTARKNPHEGGKLDSMFEELGELDEVRDIALRKMLAAELAKTMKQRR